MLQEAKDLLDEAAELEAFLQTLGDADWERATGFMGWTPWDVMAHLLFFDEVSLLALEGEDAFTARRDEQVVGPALTQPRQRVGSPCRRFRRRRPPCRGACSAAPPAATARRS